MTNEVYFYQEIKKVLQKEIPELRKIALWNNQFERQNEESSFDYPVLFIQFTPIEHLQYSRGVQNITYTITAVLGVMSLADEDTTFLDLKQKIFTVFNYFSCANWSRLTRTGERPSFDHDDYNVYETDFTCTLTDFADDNRPKIPVIVTPSLDAEIVNPDELE